MEKRAAVASIDEYIRQFQPEVQAKLRKLRKAIQERAPGATEKISYQIPTFHLNGNLVHFAAFARHVGFYPGSSAVAAFERELTAYQRAKGSIQFPIDEPLPLRLIARIVDFRVAEQSRERAARKAKGTRRSGSTPPSRARARGSRSRAS
jgi:uncharacterized protein YdhG (YjbR/CyaY superfamily)